MKLNAKRFRKLDKHAIHGNVSYVASCFSPCYNGKEMQTWVKFGT